MVLFGRRNGKGGEKAELFQYSKSDITKQFDFVIGGTSDFENE